MGSYKPVCGVSAPVHPHFNGAVWRNICSLISQTLVTSNLHTGTACWAFWILNFSKKQTAGHLLWTQLSVSTIAFSEIYCCNKSTSFYCHGWCLHTVLAQISSLDLKRKKHRKQMMLDLVLAKNYGEFNLDCKAVIPCASSPHVALKPLDLSHYIRYLLSLWSQLWFFETT